MKHPAHSVDLEERPMRSALSFDILNLLNDGGRQVAGVMPVLAMTALGIEGRQPRQMHRPRDRVWLIRAAKLSFRREQEWQRWGQNGFHAKVSSQ